MNPCEWIVCERDNRWARAIRTAIARESGVAEFARIPTLRERALKSGDFSYIFGLRLREVRTLAELAQRLEARPQSFTTLEVHRANLAHALSWMATATRAYPHGRFAALLDTTLTTPGAGSQDVVDALLEAGAAGISVSPRRLQPILALAERHAADIALQSRSPAADLSLVEWAWSQLPWQEP
jgi:hypothetical protein